MRPPEAIIRAGRQLSLEEFGAEFGRAWRRLDRRFLKLECWQTYQEPAAKSLHEFLSGDRSNVIGLLRREAGADAFVYDEVAQRDIDYARIRLVKLPLTRYLSWEMWNYIVRATLGERIVLVTVRPDVPLPNEVDFDFLLFDRATALVHDYGDDGLQVGGWLVREPTILRRLEARALELRRQAESLADFLRRDVGLPWLPGAEAVEGEADDRVGEVGGRGGAVPVTGLRGAVPLDQ
jgi:hypothetical protein